MEEPVIVCAGDAHYGMPMAVMLRSVQDNIPSRSRVTVYILDGGIRRRDMRWMRGSLDEKRLRLNCVHMDGSLTDGFPVDEHISAAGFYRLLMPDVLPDSITKVIYLDSDIIVQRDIHELWNEPFDGNVLQGVQEGWMQVSDPEGVWNWRELGLAEGSPYLNSGVLVFELDAWRSEGITAKLSQYLRDGVGRITYHDQEALNAILCNRWRQLERKWNARVDCGYEVDPFTGLKSVPLMEKLKADRAVVHFAAKVKPWHFGVEHAAVRFYFEHLDRTEWRNWRPRLPMRRLMYYYAKRVIGLLGTGR